MHVDSKYDKLHSNLVVNECELVVKNELDMSKKEEVIDDVYVLAKDTFHNDVNVLKCESESYVMTFVFMLVIMLIM